MKIAASVLLATILLAGPAYAAPIFTQDFGSSSLRGTLDATSTSDRFGVTDYYNTANTADATFTGYTHIAVDPTTGNGALHLNEAANGRAGGVSFLMPSLMANSSYSLSFLLSGDNEPGQAYNFIANIAGTTFITPGVVGASGSNPGTTYTYFFNTQAAGPYTLTLSESVDGGSSGSPIVDDVSISAVPEPATWAMMMLGFGMVGFGLRYRRKSATAKVNFA